MNSPAFWWARWDEPLRRGRGMRRAMMDESPASLAVPRTLSFAIVTQERRTWIRRAHAVRREGGSGGARSGPTERAVWPSSWHAASARFVMFPNV